MTQERTARLSKMLPPSLGSLFGQPLDTEPERPAFVQPQRNLPGAFAAPELCLLVDPYRPELLPRDAVVEVKLDGIRALHIAGRLWTREGSPFEAAEHCLPILKGMELAYGKPMFFDGEYVEDGGLERTLSSFRSKKGNGCLWLFDAVPFDEWQSGRASRNGLIARKKKLREVLLSVTERRMGVPVGYVEHVEAGDALAVERRARDVWAAGYEGLVIKSAATCYVRKRTCDWMKVKLRSVATVSVVDVLGKTVGDQETAKAVLVRLPGRGDGMRPHPVMRLGVSGSLAETIWRNRGDLQNSGSIDVEFAGFTGGGNMREPIIKSVRF